MSQPITETPHSRLEYNLRVSLNDFFMNMGFDPEVYDVVPSYGAEESNKGEMILDLYVDDPDQELPIHTIKINLKKHKNESN